MGLLRQLFGPSQAEIWGQLAAEMNGQFTDGGLLRTKQVVVSIGPWILTLDTFSRAEHRSRMTYTRLRAPFVNADNFQFKIYRERFFSSFGRWFGMQDIPIGDPRFDESFVIQGNDEIKVQRFFNDVPLKALLYAQPDLLLQVDDRWFRQCFPEEVDELYFERPGVMKDLPELRALFDLFSYSLHRLCHLGSAYENDPGIAL